MESKGCSESTLLRAFLRIWAKIWPWGWGRAGTMNMTVSAGSSLGAAIAQSLTMNGGGGIDFTGKATGFVVPGAAVGGVVGAARGAVGVAGKNDLRFVIGIAIGWRNRPVHTIGKVALGGRKKIGKFMSLRFAGSCA